MTNFNPRNPTKHVGTNKLITFFVSRDRRPTLSDYRQPETGTLYSVGTIWQVAKDPTTGTEGELWFLSKIVANQGYWVMLNSGVPLDAVTALTDDAGVPVYPNGLGEIQISGTAGQIVVTQNAINNELILSLAGGGTAIDSIGVQATSGTGTDPVLPTSDGIIEFEGAAVAAGTDPVLAVSTAANTVQIQTQISQAIAATDATKIGLSAFDSGAFSVDANGFVTLLGGGSSTTNIDVDASTAPGTDPVVPNMGNIIMTGAQVATGTIGANVIRTNSTAANTVTIEIQRSTAVALADSTKNGVAHFDSSAFSVSADGFVTLAGGAGPAIDSFTTDVAGPVVPSATGVVDVTGNNIYSDGTVLNTLTLNVDATANTFLIGAGANTPATEIGPLTDGQLIIGSTGVAPVLGNITSTNGSVTISNGAGSIDLAVAASNDAILTLTGDAGGAVSPTSGDIDIQGVTVANAANAKPVFVQGTPGSSLLEIDVQVATEITGAPADMLDAGICSFDDTSFAVDANGYVTLASAGVGKTITGDSGGALSPSSNNWNILGRSGSKTSGSGSTLTVKSPPYADASASATSSLNTGEFVTGAYTRTLPATAGLEDGDLVQFLCTSASALTITANTGQTIRLGTLVTSSGGTCTSTSIGDSVSLRWSATVNGWLATSIIGTWIIA